MSRQRSGTWIAGAVLASLLVAAAGWLLVVSPVRADAAETAERTAAAQQQNELLGIQLTQLRADFDKLDQHKADLEALRVAVPRTLDQTALLREVDGIAARSGVGLLDVTFAAPTMVDTTAAVAPDATTPQPVVVPNGLVAMDVTLTVTGAPDPVSAFLEALQGSSRIYLVTGFDTAVQEEQGATDGQAAVAAGDFRMTVRGTVYVLPDAASLPAAPADAPQETADEAPVS